MVLGVTFILEIKLWGFMAFPFNLISLIKSILAAKKRMRIKKGHRSQKKLPFARISGAHNTQILARHVLNLSIAFLL